MRRGIIFVRSRKWSEFFAKSAKNQIEERGALHSLMRSEKRMVPAAFARSILLFSCCVLLSGCVPTPIRFRLVISMEVDEQVYESSGVIETKWSYQQPWAREMTGRPWVVDVVGQAIAIDVGSRGRMFLLLVGDRSRKGSFGNMPSLLVGAIANRSVGGVTKDELAEIVRQSPSVNVPAASLPMLVRFRDAVDPRSIEHVDPTNITATFGAGVMLKGVTLEVTNAPVTTGLEHILPWAASFRGAIGYRDGRIDRSRPELTVTPRALSQGLN
jgi:hypothetical protein